MGLFDRLFGRRKDLDREKAVGQYLLRLPKCSRFVAVASPAYDPEHFYCDVTLDARRLAIWAQRHAESVTGFGMDQAARLALPIWLRAADLSDDRVTYAPAFSRVLDPYLTDFTKDESCRIHCPQCGSVVNDVSMAREDERRAGGWSWWTDVCTCPAGHELYREEHELHLHI